MTDEGQHNFNKVDECQIYNRKKLRDHYHATGKGCRSAHESCNLNFKLTDKIPVIFHNLRGYDSHFIMRQIGEIAKSVHGSFDKFNQTELPRKEQSYSTLIISDKYNYLIKNTIMPRKFERASNSKYG